MPAFKAADIARFGQNRPKGPSGGLHEVGQKALRLSTVWEIAGRMKDSPFGGTLYFLREEEGVF